MTTENLASLAAAIDAELTAEANAAQAEVAKRATWWETTWRLAEVPRAEWGEAVALYIERTGHTRDNANHRRQAGQRFQSAPEGTLLPPRMAIEGARHLGVHATEADALAMVELLRDADREGMSVREFRSQLTGRSWTQAPENMTPDEKQAVARQFAREQPQRMAEIVESDPEASRAVTDHRLARNQAHRDNIREGTDELRRVLTDPLVATVRRMARDLIQHRIEREVTGDDTDTAALASALDDVIRAAQAWRRALTEDDFTWTDADRAAAADLGVDLGSR